jgi:protein arginine kinase activator
MLCVNCSEREATIHLTQIVDNEMSTFHLCETCAAEKGLSPSLGAEATPLTGFLAQMGKEGAGEAGLAPGSCAGCGLTLAEFRRTGRLGCAQCYGQYGSHLRALLRRLHGGTQHVGKVFLPRDAARSDQAARLASLRRSLQRAVDGEDFERAAMLRDQIRELDAGIGG